MATRIAWLLNLDAEIELECPQRYRPHAQMVERVRALVPRMHLLLHAHDVLLGLSKAPCTGLVPYAFCPTPSALARIAVHGLTPQLAPPVAVLRRVNSRAFCAELGPTLPHAAYVGSMAELEVAVRAPSPTGTFVLKRPFAFAGRERRHVRDGALDASTRGFAARTFARGEGLAVEPWVERVCDFAQHGWVLPHGRLLTGPVVQQHCDAVGRWETSRLADENALDPGEQVALSESVRTAGEALHAAGYHGPYGVDAFRYRTTEGGLAFQPRCEINARFTMGYPRALLEAARKAT